MNFLDVFQKNIKRSFDPVVSVEHVDEKVVKDEVDEFIFTKITDENYEFMGTQKAYVEGMNFISQCPANQHPNIWIYGFYGCGKSLLAKMLSLSLANKRIGERSINDILKHKIRQKYDRDIVTKALEHIENVHSKMIIFNVGYQRRNNEQLHQLITRKILNVLGYRDNLTIAFVELFLIKEGQWDAFRQRYQKRFSSSWGNETTDDLIRTKILLKELVPNMYDDTDTFSKHFENIFDIDVLCEKITYAMSLSKVNKVIVCIDEISKHLDTYPNEAKVLHDFMSSIFVQLQQDICFICTGQKKLHVIDTKLQHVFGKKMCLDKADIVQIVKERFLQKKDEGTRHINNVFQRYNLTFTKDHIEAYPFHHKVFQLIALINTTKVKEQQNVQDKTTTRNLLEMTQGKFKNLDSNRFQEFDAVICIDEFDRDYDYSSDVSIALQHSLKLCREIEHALIAKRILKTLAILCRVQLQSDFQQHIKSIDEDFFHTHLQDRLSNQIPRGIFSKTLRNLTDIGLITKLSSGGYTITQTIHRRWKTYRNDLLIHNSDITMQLSKLALSHFFSKKDMKIKLNNDTSVEVHITCQPETLFKSSNQIHLKVNVHPYNKDISKYDVQLRLPEEQKLQFLDFKNIDSKDRALSQQCSLEYVEEYLRSEKTIRHFENSIDFFEEETLLQDCISKEKERKDSNERKISTELKSLFYEGNLIATKNENIHISLQSIQQDCSNDIESSFLRAFQFMADKLFYQQHPILGLKIDDNIIQNVRDINQLSPDIVKKLCEQPLRILQSIDSSYTYRNDSDVAVNIFNYISKKGRCKGSEITSYFTRIPYGYVSYTVRLVTVVLFLQDKIQFRKDETSIFIKSTMTKETDVIYKNGLFNNLIFSIQSDTLTEAEKNTLHQFIFTCTGEHYNSNINKGFQTAFLALKEPLEQHLREIKIYRIPERLESISSFLLKYTSVFQNTIVENYNLKEIFQMLHIFEEMNRISQFTINFWNIIDWFLTHRSQLQTHIFAQNFMPELQCHQQKIQDVYEKIDDHTQNWSTVYSYLDELIKIQELWFQLCSTKKEKLSSSLTQVLDNIRLFVTNLNDQEKILCCNTLIERNSCLFYDEEIGIIKFRDDSNFDLYLLDTQIKKLQQDFSNLLQNGPTESSQIDSLELQASKKIRTEQELQEFFDNIKQKVRSNSFPNSILIKKS